jgi:RNA polymerase sigma-70 factor, ECF subfamily
MEAVIEDPLRATLVAQAAGGDEVAFARLVVAYHDDMVRVCYVICGDADLAQEATQAAWSLAWRKLRSLRDPDRIRPWLVSVAANEAKGLARRHGRRSLREVAIDPETDVGPPGRRGDPASRVAEIDLANALASLGASDRMIVAMRYAAGLSSEEIGQVIGMTSGGVRARIARLLQRLRLELHDD